MAMYNNSLIDRIKSFFQSKTILSKLVLINIIVFILANISNLYLILFQVPHTESLFTDWFGVPSNLEILIRKPWSVFTYMFLQENFFHLLFNMIMLYFGGVLFLQFLGGKKMLSTYIIGGLFGAAAYIFAFNFFPVFREVSTYSIALGSSASVIAVLVAVAFYIPEYEIILFLIGKVKLKYIAIFLVVMDLLSIDKGNPGGHIAHLGGALWGFSYILFFKKRIYWSQIFNPIVLFFKNLTKGKRKLRVEFKNERPLHDDAYSKNRVDNQKKIDAILDKISKNGYHNLTKDEKDFLFSTSNKK